MVGNDTSFPPHRIHSSSRISPTEALDLITAYLDKADTDPSLHPNATLSEAGPVVPYSGVSTGLVIHNLGRLQAGLKGERMAKDLEMGDIAQGVTRLPKANGGSQADKDGEEDGMELEWQNMSEFERDEREIEEGMGPEPTGSGIMDPRDEQRVLQFSNTAQVKMDKKHAKRARKHELKREREQKRAAAAAVAQTGIGRDDNDDSDASST